MSTKVLLFCVLIAELPGWVIPIPRWEEEPLESNLLLDREESMANRFFNAEQPEHRERFLEQVKRVANSEDASLQQPLTSSTSCPCETKYYLRELSDGSYPRVLAAGRCVEKPCRNKFNACHLVEYPVYVLQQRETSHDSVKRYKSGGLPEVDLPESLRRKWQFVPQRIGIVCVPLDNKSN